MSPNVFKSSAAVLVDLNALDPNTSLLTADVVDALVSELVALLTEVQDTLSGVITGALDSVTLEISGGLSVDVLGGVLSAGISVGYDGSLSDLVDGTSECSHSGYWRDSSTADRWSARQPLRVPNIERFHEVIRGISMSTPWHWVNSHWVTFYPTHPAG